MEIRSEALPENYDAFNTRVNELNNTDTPISVLFTNFSNGHLMVWPNYDNVLIYNIYHTYDEGLSLYIYHPDQSDNTAIYTDILNCLFDSTFKCFPPLNEDYYLLHVDGKPVVIAYDNGVSRPHSSLLFIPRKSLLQEYKPRYTNSDDIVRLLKEI